jgi:hypothetical protein
LVPILRSGTQGAILSSLYLHPEREYSATDLSRLVGTSLPTVLRELDRMVPTGFLLERPVGRNRLVRVNASHPLFRPVQEIVAYGYGPLAVLPDELAGLAGLEEGYIYGSWAARNDGEVGADPADIDVLLVGDIDRMAALDAADRSTRRLRRPVNTRVVGRAAWDAASGPFLKTIRQRPRVKLSLVGGNEG